MAYVGFSVIEIESLLHVFLPVKNVSFLNGVSDFGRTCSYYNLVSDKIIREQMLWLMFLAASQISLDLMQLFSA